MSPGLHATLREMGLPHVDVSGESWTHRAPAAGTAACLLFSLSLLSVLLAFSDATAAQPWSQPEAQGRWWREQYMEGKGELVP